MHLSQFNNPCFDIQDISLAHVEEHETGSEDDDEDDYHDDLGEENRDATMDVDLRCPVPGCRRKRGFRERTYLQRHFESRMLTLLRFIVRGMFIILQIFLVTSSVYTAGSHLLEFVIFYGINVPHARPAMMRRISTGKSGAYSYEVTPLKNLR